MVPFDVISSKHLTVEWIDWVEREWLVSLRPHLGAHESAGAAEVDVLDAHVRYASDYACDYAEFDMCSFGTAGFVDFSAGVVAAAVD